MGSMGNRKYCFDRYLQYCSWMAHLNNNNGLYGEHICNIIEAGLFSWIEIVHRNTRDLMFWLNEYIFLPLACKYIGWRPAPQEWWGGGGGVFYDKLLRCFWHYSKQYRWLMLYGSNKLTVFGKWFQLKSEKCTIVFSVPCSSPFEIQAVCQPKGIWSVNLNSISTKYNMLKSLRVKPNPNMTLKNLWPILHDSTICPQFCWCDVDGKERWYRIYIYILQRFKFRRNRLLSKTEWLKFKHNCNKLE